MNLTINFLLLLLSIVAILTIILERKITQIIISQSYKNSNYHPSIFNPKTQNLLFIHISKTGGTSLDKLLKPIAKSKNFTYQGSKHYDFKQVEDNRYKHNISSFSLIQFRHPIERTISNFHFAKTRDFTFGTKMRNQSIEEYFEDEDSMLETYSIWLDGASCIWWLTGTHTSPWVNPKRNRTDQGCHMYNKIQQLYNLQSHNSEC